MTGQPVLPALLEGFDRTGREHPVVEYRSATEVLPTLDPATALHAFATRLIKDLADLQVVYRFECLLGCGRTVLHETTVAEAATYTGAPRGICGSCA